MEAGTRQEKPEHGEEQNASPFVNREIGWLAFNARVLQEAADPTTPLVERLKFLGIFSSNLDEFFRVRVAAIKRLIGARGKERARAKLLLGGSPARIMEDIQEIVFDQQSRFSEVYQEILQELRQQQVVLVNEHDLDPDQVEFVKDHFHQEIRPLLLPIMLENLSRFPALSDHSVYLAVRMLKGPDSNSAPRHALIEVPAESRSRFLVLPPKDGGTPIILLDDVIRVGLGEIFSLFGFRRFEAYTIKLTRDAVLDIEDDITINFMEKISKGLKRREKAQPVRFVYDVRIPDYFLRLLIKKNRLTTIDSLIPGDRYHNFKDFMEFPSLGRSALQYEPLPQLPHPQLNPRASTFEVLRRRDILLSYPYHSFNYFIDLLREASIDPRVESIKISLYRLARNSNVVNSLINAIRNGKEVTVIMELQARFDEEANLYWTDRLREEGARILYGVPDLKVHSKVLLIARRERRRLVRYANISTGNYNEATARLYCDHSFFTADPRITDDLEQLFEFFEHNHRAYTFEHLLVSPFSLRQSLVRLIRSEMELARQGRPAYIILKTNNLADRPMIDLLYEAGQAGVRIELIVRGACSLVPGVPGVSDNIRAISIVDRFLEHSRIFLFGGGGTEQLFISSADLMNRNLDRRVEVACPIYDEGLRRELKALLELQLRDNVKARLITPELDNRYLRPAPGEPPVHSQLDYYELLKRQQAE